MTGAPWVERQKLTALLVSASFIVLIASGCEPGRTATKTPTATPIEPPTEVPTQAPAATPTKPPAATPTEPPAPTPTVEATFEGPPSDASAGDSWIRPMDGMVMVYVPAGEFEMGSNDPFYNNERPPHTVALDGFWLDRTEVTNAQYRQCVEAGACKLPSSTGAYSREAYFDDSAYDDYPVIFVNWYRAAVYCKWAGGRLPTEEEWEYAARGPEGRWFPWGDTPDGTRLNHCDANCPLTHADSAFDDGYSDTAPVGSYPPGASWCGVLDLLGNAWEWVADWYGYYPSEENPPWLSSAMTDRVIRGGAWDTERGHARCTFRSWFNPAKSHDSIGFRCAISQPVE